MNKIHQLFAVLAAGFLCLPAAAQEISTAQVVDLGLSVKWAGYNIGASAPEQYGSFYAWGETSEKEQYIDATYKWYQDGNTQAILKYCADDYGFQFSVGQGRDPYGMCRSLEKLNSLSSGKQSSSLAKMFSSHPDSAKRAEKMRKKADAYTGKTTQ